MTATAKGPNGHVMLALSTSQSAAENRQARTFLNGQHQEADRRPAIREKIKAGEMAVEDVALDRRPDGSFVKLTIRWAVPRQIPLGPHAGKWCIPVPADEARRYQRDPRTGEITDRPAPEWAGAEIVEDDPAWRPSEEL